MAALSKTQVDHLGDRLRNGPHSEADLRLLDEYRLSFGPSYEFVLHRLREHSQAPTGRFPKSTPSIVEKLRRESIRLSQVQDIAGCRVIVTNIAQQEKLANELRSDFPSMIIVDRRKTPSHGYRAVHIIVEVGGKHVEIQARTALQHQWAEISEKASDVIDATIKYGGGDDFWRPLLLQSSDFISSCEDMEGVNFDATNRKRLKSYRNSILKILGYMLLLLDKTKERKA